MQRGQVRSEANGPCIAAVGQPKNVVRAHPAQFGHVCGATPMSEAQPIRTGREGGVCCVQQAQSRTAIAQPLRTFSTLTTRADDPMLFAPAASTLEGRVILYLGGIHQSAQNVEQYLKDWAREQCNFRGALVTTCGATGFGNATLSGPGALQAAILLLGRHSDSVGIAEVKEHARAWYCPCGHPTLCNGAYTCHGCGGARPSSLLAALEQALRRHGCSALPAARNVDSGGRGPRSTQSATDNPTLHRRALTPPPPRASSSMSAAAARRNANATNPIAAVSSKRSTDSIDDSAVACVNENRVPEVLEAGDCRMHAGDSGASPHRKAARRDACDAASASSSRAAQPIPAVATAPRISRLTECNGGACCVTGVTGGAGGAGAAGAAGAAGGAGVRQRVPLFTSTWSEHACFGFRKLAAAEALAAQNGCSWRVWAEDVAGAHGAPKRYFTSKVEAIHRLICSKPAGHRHFYEVIDQGLPCWSYFDLEYDVDTTSGLNSQVDGNELTRRIIDAASDVLRESFEMSWPVGFSGRGPGREGGDAPQLRIEVLVLDSHRTNKFSRHLLLRTHASQGSREEGGEPRFRAAPLSGSEHAGRVARAVTVRLGDALAVDKPHKDGACKDGACEDEAQRQPTNFIDLSVYSRSRCFRLMGCSKGGGRKLGSEASPRLTPNWEFTSSSLAPFLQSAGQQSLLASLVVPVIQGDAASNSHRTIDISAALCESAPLSCAQQRADAMAGEGGAATPLCGTCVRSASSANGNSILLTGEPAIGAARRCMATGEVPAETAPAAADTEAPQPEAAWVSHVRLLSAAPLLDLVQSISHPFICAKTHGGGMPPLPFSPLAEWALQQIRAFGAGFPGATIGGWRYCRSAHPTEALLHLMPKGTRFCYHIGREHRSQNTMLTISLIEERAWQRCWDADCVVPSNVPAMNLKAKHSCSSPPPSLVPSLLDLIRFERSRRLLNEDF